MLHIIQLLDLEQKMTKIKTKYSIGDEVYYLQQSIDYVSAIPALRKFTINAIVIGHDGVAYKEYDIPVPEEELFSSVDEAIEFVTNAMRQSAEDLIDVDL